MTGHFFSHKIRLVVVYGSQTGTAQDVAEQIWRESKHWGFSGPVLGLDELGLQKLCEEELVVFVVATTGNGDEPDNMTQTWKQLLRRSLSPLLLQRLQYACIGLGDSSYAKYNWAAKKLNKRLQQLGATAVLPLGLCDDQHDYGQSAASLPWIEQLWKELGKSLPLQENKDKRTEDASRIFKWHVEVLEGATSLANVERLCWPYEKPSAQKYLLKENVRTTAPAHFQDVRLLRFEVPTGVTWHAGDVLQLRPCNADTQVAQFFALVEEHHLNFTADTIVQLESAHEDMPLPTVYAQPATVTQLVKFVWDLNAKPRQRAFELLALNCEDELERDKLLEFSSAAGLGDLIEYINRPRRTILEVLQDFRHATSKLTLPILCELFGIIQPRSFSIASTPLSGSLDLLVAVVEYRTKLSTPRLGLCSNWLKALPTDTNVFGAIRPGTFVIPNDVRTPIIMVGPGTGIAPFRALIQSREEAKANGLPVGQMLVFFGCRGQELDYHFREDFTRWQMTNLIELFVAFSRDQEHKIYVQHLIKEQADKVKALIRGSKASIFVSGSSNNMPQAVKEAFTDALEGDEAYVEEMVKAKRYQEETWS